MGRNALVTYEQVAAVCDTLKAEGTIPTTRLVRERLGNVGSMGTVTNFVQQWKAALHPPEVQLALPASVQRGMLEYMGQELAAAKAALEADLGALQQEVGDLAQENESLLGDLAERAEALAAAELTVSRIEGREAQLRLELEAARQEAGSERAAAENTRVELARAQLRLEAMPRLENDLAEARAALEQERGRRVVAEQQAAVTATRLEAAQATLEREGARYDAEIDRAMAESTLAEQARERLEVELVEREREWRTLAERQTAAMLEAHKESKPVVRQGSIRAGRQPHR